MHRKQKEGMKTEKMHIQYKQSQNCDVFMKQKIMYCVSVSWTVLVVSSRKSAKCLQVIHAAVPFLAGTGKENGTGWANWVKVRDHKLLKGSNYDG